MVNTLLLIVTMLIFSLLPVAACEDGGVTEPDFQDSGGQDSGPADTVSNPNMGSGPSDVVSNPNTGDSSGDDSRDAVPRGDGWVAVPAEVKGVDVERRGDGYLLTVAYVLVGGSECAELESSGYEMEGWVVRVMVDVREKWGDDKVADCESEPREESLEIEMPGPLEAGEMYHVVANGGTVGSFTPVRDGFPESVVALSPIDSAELVVMEIFPLQYSVYIVSGLPKGSGCSQFDGFSVERSGTDIEIEVRHHEVAPGVMVACTADYPYVETSVALGDDFEAGVEYRVMVNDAAPIVFVGE